MKHTLHQLVLAILVLGLAGCATDPKVAENFALSTYATFDIAPLQRADGGKVRPEVDTAVTQTLEKELTARGLRRVQGGGASVVVAVRGGVGPRVDPRFQGYAAQGGVPIVRGTSVDIDKQNSGTLEVFLFDAKTKNVVWQRSTTRNFITKPPPADKVVDALLEILKDLGK